MDKEVDDLSNLPILKEDIILDHLKTRYFKGKYYVSIISLFHKMFVNQCIKQILSYINICFNSCKVKYRTSIGALVTYLLLAAELMSDKGQVLNNKFEMIRMNTEISLYIYIYIYIRWRRQRHWRLLWVSFSPTQSSYQVDSSWWVSLDIMLSMMGGVI